MHVDSRSIAFGVIFTLRVPINVDSCSLDLEGYVEECDVSFVGSRSVDR
jgi:hypothetical protein